MCAIYVVLLCVGRFGLGSAYDVFKFVRHMPTHCHAYIPSVSYILIYYCVSTFFILSLSLHSCVSMLLWHLNANLLYPRTFCILGHLLPLTPHLLLFSSMMRTPERTSLRTFVDEAFIWNATLFCQTFLTFTYQLSFTIEVENHFMTSRSLVPLRSYKSFTLICIELILQYLISFVAFEVGIW